MNHGSLFSGIGGFDLAAEWMGWENLFHCEWMEFPRKVLDYYWPDADSHVDICKTDFKKYEGTIDIISGGFPCQPFSLAGKRKGKDDERHLWPEMLRAISEIRPRWVVGENVLGLVNWSGGLVFHEVQADLEAQGYEVQPFLLPAAAVNAPHRRDRIWFVAHSNSNGQHQCNGNNEINTGKRWINAQRNFKQGNVNGNSTNTDSTNNKTQPQKRILGQKNKIQKTRGFINGNTRTQWTDFPSQPPICGGNDGLPAELDGITFSKWRNESIKGYGNAVVPQVVYQIFKAIKDYELQKM